MTFDEQEAKVRDGIRKIEADMKKTLVGRVFWRLTTWAVRVYVAVGWSRK